MQILAISENAPYCLGGAERSLFTYITKIVQDNDNLTVVGLYRDTEKLDYEKIVRSSSIVEIKCSLSKFFIHFHFFYTFLTFAFNFKKLSRYISSSDYIYTQNRWAPYVAFIYSIINRNSSAAKKVTIFVRDEKCVLHNKCYSNGLRKLLWYSRFFLETPFRWIHIFLTYRAHKNCFIVYNSYFMKDLARKKGLISKNSTVLKPQVNFIDKKKCQSWLTHQSNEIKKLFSMREKNIVLVGCEKVKGYSGFLKMSRLLPQYNFIVFSKRASTFERKSNNLFIHPWCYVSGVPYISAKTIIVPSLWNEAFGRVVVEAKQFSCNVIISNRGGLKEALGDYNNGRVASSFDEYINFIEEFLN